MQWMLDGELYYVGYACKIITHTNHLAKYAIIIYSCVYIIQFHPMMGWGEEARCKTRSRSIIIGAMHDQVIYGSQHIRDHMQPSTGLVYGQSRIYNLTVACTVGGFGGLSTPLSSQKTMKLI